MMIGYLFSLNHLLKEELNYYCSSHYRISFYPLFSYILIIICVIVKFSFAMLFFSSPARHQYTVVYCVNSFSHEVLLFSLESVTRRHPAVVPGNADTGRHTHILCCVIVSPLLNQSEHSSKFQTYVWCDSFGFNLICIKL